MQEMLFPPLAPPLKRCPKCSREKALSAFSKRTTSSLKPCSYCVPCQRSYSRAHYRRNKTLHSTRRLERNTTSRKAIKRFVMDYLLAHCCVDCGERDIIVLEFDHVRGFKTDDIGNMLNRRTSLAKIEMELSKCDVRCANCHRRRTARQRNWQMRRVEPSGGSSAW